jgi:nicotinic acetylcholine receptor
MKSNVWLRLVWNDYQLQWDEAGKLFLNFQFFKFNNEYFLDYGGIGVLRLPPDKVWKVSKLKG